MNMKNKNQIYYFVLHIQILLPWIHSPYLSCPIQIWPNHFLAIKSNTNNSIVRHRRVVIIKSSASIHWKWQVIWIFLLRIRSEILKSEWNSYSSRQFLGTIHKRAGDFCTNQQDKMYVLPGLQRRNQITWHHQ